MFIKYTNFKELEPNNNPDLYINSVLRNIQKDLELIEAKSEIQNHKITFKRIIRNTTHSGENQQEAWEILREGEIEIIKKETKVVIHWSVKLDKLIFLAISIGIAVGLLFEFVISIPVLPNLLASLGLSILVYIIGYFFIKSEIDGIVERAI